MPRADGLGRVPAVEVMIATAVHPRLHRRQGQDRRRSTARSPPGTSQYGMQTFDQSIFSLYQQGFVTLEEALRWARTSTSSSSRSRASRRPPSMARDEMAQSTRRRPARHHPLRQLTPRDCDVRLPRRAPPARPPRADGRRVPRPAARSRALRRRQIDAAIAHLARDRRPRRPARSRAPTPARRSTVKGRGRLRILRELQARGIDKDVAAEARRRGLRRQGRARARRPGAPEEAARAAEARDSGRVRAAVSVPDAPGLHAGRHRRRRCATMRGGATGRSTTKYNKGVMRSREIRSSFLEYFEQQRPHDRPELVRSCPATIRRCSSPTPG